jgi:dolichol-phosphate mannosyltransferase
MANTPQNKIPQSPQSRHMQESRSSYGNSEPPIDLMRDLLTVPTGPLQITRLPESRQAIIQPSESSAAPLTVRLSLVVPTYNESGNVPKIAQHLSELLDQAIPGAYEIIVVDDNSPDQTWSVAQALTPQYPGLQVMRRQQERGLSTAVIRGWQAAQGEVLGVIDGDLQHPPAVLLKLLEAVEQGADMAVASRHVEGGGVSTWSMTRRILSRGAQLLGLVLCPRVVGRVSDPMSGYFMVRRSAIAGPVLSPEGYKILLEVLGRGAIGNIAEVGYVFQERSEGESKVTKKQYFDYIRHLLKLRVDSGRLGRLKQQFPIGRFLRFGLVGFSGVFVDMAIFFLLRSAGLPIARSTMLSAEVAVINNFLWNDVWTFGDISKRQRGNRARFKRFLKFNLICLAGIIIQALLVSALHDVFGMSEFIAKLVAIAAVTLWNFWINLKLSWRVTDVQGK